LQTKGPPSTGDGPTIRAVFLTETTRPKITDFSWAASGPRYRGSNPGLPANFAHSQSRSLATRHVCGKRRAALRDRFRIPASQPIPESSDFFAVAVRGAWPLPFPLALPFAFFARAGAVGGERRGLCMAGTRHDIRTRGAPRRPCRALVRGDDRRASKRWSEVHAGQGFGATNSINCLGVMTCGRPHAAGKCWTLPVTR